AVKTRVDVCSDLWPHSSRALYAHIESHMQILRSLGVEACLRHGNPRMISLRGCQVETTARKPPSVTPAFNRITSDPPISLVPLPDDQKISDAHCCGVHLVEPEAVSRDIPKITSESRERDPISARTFFSLALRKVRRCSYRTPKMIPLWATVVVVKVSGL